MGEWQPIKTAPRDGTLILASNSETCAVVGWTIDPLGPDFPDTEDGWTDVGGMNRGAAVYFNPLFFTHWQPLPEMPHSAGAPT